MNETFAKGKWKELKGELLKTWGKITGDELEASRGDMTAIAGLVQQRYGLAKEDASYKVNAIFRRYGSEFGQTLEQVKEKVASSVERVKQNAKDALHP